MGYQFLHKEYIWLLGALILFGVLFFLLWRWKKQVVKRIGDAHLVKALTGNYSSALFSLKSGMLSLAFAAGVLAVMDLRKPAGEEGIERKGIDVVIALDVSKSMLATDLPPNRLERARQLINKLMDAMPDDRIGLVLFAGKAYLQMPLTTDHEAARMFVASANPDAVPQQGTVISDALQMSSNAFNAAERRFKAVVLISDGEDHDPAAITTAKELSSQGMMINTVGIGSPEGSYIPDPETGENKRDAAGNQVISKLNEDELKQLAESTNGVYVRLQDSDDAVRQLKAQLSQIETRAYGDVSLMNFNTYYVWFALAMFILILAEYFIPETKRKKAKHIAAMAVLFFFTQGLSAQESDRLIQRGNDLYKQQQYQQAEQVYTDVLALDPNNTTAKFNQANALYKQNKADEAVKVLNDLAFKTNDQSIKAKAYYNKGAILSGQKKLEESIDAYKDALRQDPADKDARENLQKALLELKKKNPKKEDNKKQPQKQQQKPQPKMSQKEAEQRLKLLEQKEKQVQQRLQKEKSKQGGGQGKDW